MSVVGIKHLYFLGKKGKNILMGMLILGISVEKEESI
jgi:hypothetical protein